MKQMRSNTAKAETIPSRVQSTARFSREIRLDPLSDLSALAAKVGVDVYDSVRAANEAGVPMPPEVFMQ